MTTRKVNIGGQVGVIGREARDKGRVCCFIFQQLPSLHPPFKSTVFSSSKTQRNTLIQEENCLSYYFTFILI